MALFAVAAELAPLTRVLCRTKNLAFTPPRARERWETSLACAGARTMMMMLLHGGR